MEEGGSWSRVAKRYLARSQQSGETKWIWRCLRGDGAEHDPQVKRRWLFVGEQGESYKAPVFKELELSASALYKSRALYCPRSRSSRKIIRGHRSWGTSEKLRRRHNLE